jgi:outer membrane protein TolC
MRSTLITSVALLLVLAPEAASPQTTADVSVVPTIPAQPLSLMETLQQAVANNVQLRRDRVSIDIEDAQLMAARGNFDFVLTGTLSFQRSLQPPLTAQDIVSGYTNDFGFDLGIQRNLESGGTLKLALQNDAINTNSRLSCGSPTGVATTCTYYNSQFDLTFTHPLLRGFGVEITEANIRRNKIQKDVALLTRQMDAANVLRDVITGYWELAYATQALAISNSAVDLAREQLRITKAQIDVGRLAPIDRAAVERAIGDRLQDVALAQQTLYGRTLDLRRLLGTPVDPAQPPLSAVDMPTAAPHDVDIAGELRHALETNPQLRSLKMGFQLNEIDIQIAENTIAPQLNFVGDIGSRGKNSNFAQTLAQTGGLDSLTISGALNFQAPLENRAANGNYRAAKLILEQSRLDAGTMELGIRDSVIRTSVQIKTASVRVDLAKQTVGFAEQNLEAEKARFSVGRSTNNDVLLRQQELKSAQISVIRANVDLLESDVALSAITAEILERYGVVLKGLK